MGNSVFRQEGARVLAATEAAERMQNEGTAFVAIIADILELQSVPPVPETPDLLRSTRKVAKPWTWAAV